MKYIDVHCHPDDENFGDSDGFFARAKSAGVEKVICAGVDLQTSLYASRLAENYDGCYFTAGIHPTETAKAEIDDLEQIYKLARHPMCVAIGEIGLDYHYPDTDKERQKDYFIRQLSMASKLGLPVQIHSRDSAEDMLDLLKTYAPTLKSGILLHCYSHSAEIAAELEKLGCYFSFGGTCTYSGSKKVRKTIAALSSDRIMTETDSPYLPPKSRQGIFPNTPESIPEILNSIAAVRGVPPEDMARTVWDNAHALFKKLCN